MRDGERTFIGLRLRCFRGSLDFDEAKGGLELSTMTIARLAEHLLESNKHLHEFEVELGDDPTCTAVAKELERRGCTVERDPFKFLLLVSAPDFCSLPKTA